MYTKSTCTRLDRVMGMVGGLVLERSRHLFFSFRIYGKTEMSTRATNIFIALAFLFCKSF